MNGKALAPVLLMFSIVVLTSCRSAYEVADEKAIETADFLTQDQFNDNLTKTALVELLTPRPSETLVPSETPVCYVWTPSGVCATNPDIRLAPLPDGTANPSKGDGSSILSEQPFNCEGLWICYYSESGQVLGQVRRGSFWAKEGSLSILSGWVAKTDASFSEDGQSGVTAGCSHTWGHYQNRSLTHAKIYDSVGKLIATMSSGMDFEVIGTASIKRIPDCQGVIVSTDGIVITLTDRVNIP